MSPTNQCLRYRHHFGSYILANDKSWPRQYFQPSDCNQSHHQIDCLQMRVTIEEVDDTEEGHGSDGEFNEGFIELGSDIIDADGSCEAAVDDAIIATDFVEENEAVVVMEYEHRVDVQLEVNDKVGIAPKLIGFGRDNKVQRVKVSQAVRRSSRLLKKSKDGGDKTLDKWSKKKVTRWMTRKRCNCCNELSED